MTARRRWILGCTALVVALGSARLTLGAVEPEQKCQADRAKAAGGYANCVLKALEKLKLVNNYVVYNVAAGRCVTKYAATWAKLQTKASGTGTTCDQARFEYNLDGTVMDWLTGLQWEQKTDDTTVHDKDNYYQWSNFSGGPADGDAFTAFLSALNSGACFAGQCDWRLPTRDELLTLVTPAFPGCSSGGPCIDPVFGPTVAGPDLSYWSATTAEIGIPGYAYDVFFDAGSVQYHGKNVGRFVRAVRSGL
jgi:Protein of unknown function (DUF1566)